MSGPDITHYIHVKEYQDPVTGENVMKVNDVAMLISRILKDNYEDLKNINKILEENTSMLQKLIRKDGLVE